MPVDRIDTLNQVQVNSTFPLNQRTVVQPTTHYTCPAGKQAIVKYRIQCDSLGAAATTFATIGGVRVGTWASGSIATASFGENAMVSNITTLVLGGWATGEVTIEAGDTVVTDQNTGTNAEFNVFLTITEF